MNEARMQVIAFITAICLIFLHLATFPGAFLAIETRDFLYRALLLGFSCAAAGIGVAFVIERSIHDAVVLFRKWQAWRWN